jgi:hypothetical protein
MNCFFSSMLNRSIRRRKEEFTLCGGGFAPVRRYKSGMLLLPDRIDCISTSVLNLSQFVVMLKFVYLGQGTYFSPRPSRAAKLCGGCIVVHRLCTDVFVQRMKNCVTGRLAMMFVSVVFGSKIGVGYKAI